MEILAPQENESEYCSRHTCIYVCICVHVQQGMNGTDGEKGMKGRPGRTGPRGEPVRLFGQMMPPILLRYFISLPYRGSMVTQALKVKKDIQESQGLM